MNCKETAIQYADSIARGERPGSKWMAAAARRWLGDLERPELSMDWDELDRLNEFYASLPLVEDHAGQSFALAPWQLWCLSNVWCWRWSEDGRRRVTKALLQVARGNGKTTLMAGLALYDLHLKSGRRVYCIANREEQAALLVDKAKLMVRGMRLTDAVCRQYTVERRDHDCVLGALPARPNSIDGLTPSLWIADEAAEYRNDALRKLTSAAAKRVECLGVVISTPADNPDGIYGALVDEAHAILKGENQDDATVAMLYQLDEEDELSDESAWLKANPGMEVGQPNRKSLRRSWETMRATPLGRAEFSRYHCCRMAAQQGGWLDMGFFPEPSDVDWSSLRGRPAWAGLDLSKNLDLSAFVVAVPLDDGRVALRGTYWWPAGNAAQREIDYRLPVRTWAARGFLRLTPGEAINYDAILQEMRQAAEEFQLQSIAFDPYGAKYLAETAVNPPYSLPLVQYSQGWQNVAPSCQLFQQYWVSRRIVLGDDPVFRNACRTAIAQRDTNGNVRIDKRCKRTVIDPLAAALMALHAWGGETASVYNDL